MTGKSSAASHLRGRSSASPVCASPWDALLRAPARTRQCDSAERTEESRPATKLSMLLAELSSRDDAETLALAVSCDLDPKQVWGLLKAPRACGQVRFEDGRWSLVRDFAGRDVQKAVALLRSKGWSVEPPTARTVHTFSN